MKYLLFVFFIGVLIITIMFSLFFVSSNALADNQVILYSLTGPPTNKTLVSINIDTGETIAIGEVGDGFDPEGLAYNPSDQSLYASTGINNTACGGPALICIDPSTGVGECVGLYDLEVNAEIDSLSFSPDGILYGMSEHSWVYTIDITTGVATAVGQLEEEEQYGWDESGIAFAPDGTLYGVDARSDKLFIINYEADPLEAIGVGDLGYEYINGLDFHPITGELYGIDLATSELITINTDTGQGTTVVTLNSSVATPTNLPYALAFDCLASPEISLSVTPDTLWPPNHKMVKIIPSFSVSNNCSCEAESVVELISCTMNEEDVTNTYDPLFDFTEDAGNTINDIQIIDGDIYLRAERAGNSTGRIYTLTYTATDCFGNKAAATATVTVPHNQ